MKINELYQTLKKLTIHVRKTKGEKAALLFYVNYIQPIKKYFKVIDQLK